MVHTLAPVLSSSPLPLISLTKSYSPFKIWPKCFVHPQTTHDTWPHGLPPYVCSPYHVLSHISVASALVCFSHVIIWFLRRWHQLCRSLSTGTRTKATIYCRCFKSSMSWTEGNSLLFFLSSCVVFAVGWK